MDRKNAFVSALFVGGKKSSVILPWQKKEQHGAPMFNSLAHLPPGKKSAILVAITSTFRHNNVQIANNAQHGLQAKGLDFQ